MNVQDLAWYGGATPAQTVTKGNYDEVVWTSAGASIDDLGNISIKAARQKEKSLNPIDAFSLSVAVNSAVRAYYNNIGKCQWRVFTRNGEEVKSGELLKLLRNPAPRLSSRAFIEEVVAWYNIGGEYLIDVRAIGGSDFPNRLTPLSPFRAVVEKPDQPRSRGDIVQWRYFWQDGATEYIRADHVIHDAMFNPNSNSVRGLSPLVTGAVIISGQHAAEKFNKSFFDNSAIPSHIVAIQGNMPRAQRQDFERRYIAEHSTYGDNGHKVMVVSGADEVSVVPIEQKFDGAFLDTQKHGDLKVGQLYRVPAIEMGIYDKTRFDTAAEERKLFLESTLLPQIEKITESFQYQLVDPFFQFSNYTVSRPRLNKSMGAMLEKARSDRPESNLIVLLDPDSMPIMNDVKLAQMEYAEKLRANFNMSAQETSDWLKMDIEPRPERMDVWVDRKFMNVTNPAMNALLQPGMTGEGTGEKKPGEKKPEKPAKKELTAAERATQKAAKQAARKLRVHTLKTIDAGLWSLADGDAVAPEHKSLVRIVRHGLREAIKGAAEVRDAAKAYFDQFDAKELA